MVHFFCEKFAAWDCSFCHTSVVKNYFEVYKILTCGQFFIET